jgi:ribonuclease P protein component
MAGRTMPTGMAAPGGAKTPQALGTADFPRVLGAPQKARSPHFALHFVADRPTLRTKAVGQELSTSRAPIGIKAVDNIPESCWLGSVVPKRHARRAVTRNLMKRQIRAAWAQHADQLPHGLWVLRLRAAFDARQFPSAASDALRCAVRSELDGMLARACGTRA